MKKFMIVSFLFAFLFASNVGAKEAVTSEKNYGTEISTLQKDNNFFNKIKTKVNTKINTVKARIIDGKDNFKSYNNLRKAILLMAIGLIILIVGSYIHHLVVVVGAIIFLVGALFLIMGLL